MLRMPRGEKQMVRTVTSVSQLLAMREEVHQLAIGVGPAVNEYIARLSYGTNPHVGFMDKWKRRTASRTRTLVEVGGSPRCAMDLKMAAAALAHAMDERHRCVRARQGSLPRGRARPHQDGSDCGSRQEEGEEWTT